MELSARTLTIIGIAALVACAGGFIVWKKARPSVAAPTSIAITRFKSAGSVDREEGLALSLAESLKVALTNTGKAAVLDAQGPRPGDQAALARSISAESYLTGSVQTDGQIVHVSVSLVSAEHGRPLWSGTYEGTVTNWFSVEDRVAGELLSALWRELPVVQRRTGDPEADQLYWRGRFAMEEGSRQALRNAGVLFQQAAAKDQADALAWSGLAEASLLLSNWDAESRAELVPRVRVVAHRAVTLDPTLAEPHTSLGLVAENYDLDWEQANHELKRATDLDPNDAMALLWYGEFLVETGKTDDGFVLLKRAKHLEPVSPLVKAIYAKCLYLNRKYDEAIAMAQSALALNQDSVVARRWLVAAYFQKSDLQNFASELVKLGAPSTPLTQAAAAIGSGNKDRAMELLESAFTERESGLITLKEDPAFDALRTDQRFQNLLARLHLR